MKHQQTKDLMTPSYYENENGEDLFTQFKNGLIQQDEYIGFLKGNAFKYLQRYNLKDQKESDLYKLKDYIVNLHNFMIGVYDKETETKVKDNLNREINLAFSVIPKTKEFSSLIYNELIFNKLKDTKSRLPYASKKNNLIGLILLADLLIGLELGE